MYFTESEDWDARSNDFYRKGAFLVDPAIQPVASWGFVLKINSYEATSESK